MLYRTLHNSFLLPFTPFSHSPSSHSHLLPLSSPQGMEGLNLKAGQEMVEEFVSGDDLFVDELLDFSELEEEQEQPSSSPAETVTEEGKGDCCVLTEEKVVIDGKRDDFGGVNGSELNVEAEGLESLEWLSHFVDDSFPDYSLAGKFVPEKKPELPAPAQEQPCFTTPLQTKTRTKRARTGVRVWPVLSPSPVESSTSSISSSSSTNSFPLPSLWVQPTDPRPAKKPKKKPAEGGAAAAAAQPRKCSHCGVTKTPQWRAGPLGSKTLCNACGVRFKSGRLLPEYRPACSPTFSSELHSNNHRKVLEMRRQKETETGDAGPLQPVQSF